MAPTPMQRVDVTGSDRVKYLEDVTSQHLLDVPVTHVRSALVLDTHGAPNAMFDVVVLGDRLALLVPDEEVRTTVMDVLAQRTFLLDARFQAREDQIVSVRGEQTPEVVGRAGLTVVAGRCRVAGDLLLVSRPGGMDISGPPTAVQEAVQALLEAGARQGDHSDLEAWRVSQGQPAWGREVTPPHLPEELGLLPTHVHLAKGCYPGQEAVARMWMLGRPRRRLAVVTVEGAVSAGWRAGSGRQAIEVTSVSPDGMRALAFVPADATAGASFGAEDGDSTTVTVAELVGGEELPPGHDPAVPRRRDRR
ncbi:MAG: hypothetical protein R6V28_00660 [Nitriliruptoraceae bacterium]